MQEPPALTPCHLLPCEWVNPTIRAGHRGGKGQRLTLFGLISWLFFGYGLWPPSSLNLLANAWPGLTGNQGPTPERVHTNPLPLLKRSLKGQGLWTGVTDTIFNHAWQAHLWHESSSVKQIHSCSQQGLLGAVLFHSCSALTGNPLCPQRVRKARRGLLHDRAPRRVHEEAFRGCVRRGWRGTPFSLCIRWSHRVAPAHRLINGWSFLSQASRQIPLLYPWRTYLPRGRSSACQDKERCL